MPFDSMSIATRGSSASRVATVRSASSLATKKMFGFAGRAMKKGLGAPQLPEIGRHEHERARRPGTAVAFSPVMHPETLLEYPNPLICSDGAPWIARACGRPRPDGLWEG